MPVSYTHLDVYKRQARGGSGDVLAGMTAALLACGLPAYEASACAVYLHGAAADRAAAALGEYGMLPHDIDVYKRQPLKRPAA